MVLACFCAEKVSDIKKKNSNISNKINWLPYSEALKLAKEQGKPCLILIEDPRCEGCNMFKEEFKASPKVQEMSSQMILASINKLDAPKDFQVDGDYVPRIYFASSEGEVMAIYNELGNPKRKYNYPTLRSLLVSMNDAIKLNKKKV